MYGQSVAEYHVLDPHANDLGHPRTRVVEQGQQQSITLAQPTCSRDVEYREHLLARKESDHWLVETLHWHRQRLLD